MKRLLIIPHQQSTGVYILHRDDPDSPMRWIMPESVAGAWGFELVKGWYYVPGARWESRSGGCMAQEHRIPGMGSWRVELRPTEDYVEAHLVVRSERSFPVADVASCPCWEFRNASAFYGAEPGTEALRRAWIPSGGSLVRLADTDRRRSLEGVLPVYPVQGGAGPQGWRDRVADGYGWGLSDVAADDGFIGLESVDGCWATGTVWQGAYSLSFNTRPPWHGCIHSLPYLGTLPAGGSLEATGRAWIVRGGIRELYARAARP